jgi:hypothetical protein
MVETADVLQILLAAVLAPALVLAGVLDWACHRRMRIEHNAGIKECALHLAMLLQLGCALLAVLLLELNALLFTLLFGLLLAHELSYVADLRHAEATRRIPAVEQWVHGFQHMLPWVAFAGLLALHPGQALAALHAPGHAGDWRLAAKAQALPGAYVVGLMGAALVFNALPFVEEFWRALSALRAQRRPGPQAPAAGA